MNQIVQDLKGGETRLEKVPVPKPGPGEVLIRAKCSVVSPGTERMLVKFGKAGFLEKSRQQPEKVRQVFEKMRSDGIRTTLEAVYRKLNLPIPLGYSMAGEVVEIGKGVKNFSIGDRVISNGAHADYVVAPENLIAKIPDNVTYEDASFTVIGAIALQGIRLVSPQFGETVVVVGLGLIGLITCQLLKSNGCNVIAFDPDTYKRQKAEQLGVTTHDPSKHEPELVVKQCTENFGADAVIITASSDSDQVIKQSAQMSRKRGRIVLVGVVGLKLDRSDFYEKELTFQVSCSYGPGRYDQNYEQKGFDYPLPYVRWTENRNFQTILSAISKEELNVQALVSRKVPLNEFHKIYEYLDETDSIASLIFYSNKSEDTDQQRIVEFDVRSVGAKDSLGSIAMIGAGSFADAMILPCLSKENADIKYLVSQGGLSSTHLAKKYNIRYSTTEYDSVLKDESVNGVVIATRHHQHAEMVIKALNAGKHVFVEKPLALTVKDLNGISDMINKTGLSVTVGFNRRFSPFTTKIKKLIGSNPGPISIIATINAGYIPIDSWVHDLEVGGGRIIGEACHFIDLLHYLADSPIKTVYTTAMGENPTGQSDTASIHLSFKNGSVGVVNYFSNGSKQYQKERIEIYSEGRTLILDNFKSLYNYGFDSGFNLRNRIMKSKQDKGHRQQFRRLLKFWKGTEGPLIPHDSIYNTSMASFAAVESMINGDRIRI